MEQKFKLIKNTRKAIIVDIDGTLRNCDNRLKFLEGDKKDWDSFYEYIRWDFLNEWCKAIIEKFQTDCTIILLTGRPSKSQVVKDTIAWLKSHSINFDELYFRKEGDYRSDCIVKKEIYESQIKHDYNILFVLEDRKRVTQMWRDIGLTCLQCAEGDF